MAFNPQDSKPMCAGGKVFGAAARDFGGTSLGLSV